MKENEFTNEEIKINYDLIKKIEKHAQTYNSHPDKKNFLRNVCAYEQKYILMNSMRPYDVLKYLDDLDLKSSRLVLEELNYAEIKKILDLFTHEDKTAFYKTFSDLSLIIVPKKSIIVPNAGVIVPILDYSANWLASPGSGGGKRAAAI